MREHRSTQEVFGFLFLSLFLFLLLFLFLFVCRLTVPHFYPLLFGDRAVTVHELYHAPTFAAPQTPSLLGSIPRKQLSFLIYYGHRAVTVRSPWRSCVVSALRGHSKVHLRVHFALRGRRDR